ncbi:hypothetical protein EII33_05955 [Bacteroides heparinolyticus]|uniref:Uncharacterized protein n=1 Tax=Prevotella heparinolytica TaxID=28113 RepID=A0A3P2AB61_9BACE|nr:hypothetical protein [Bacteroides heparinolyticus]RRD91956.1 hypothetical protein EII33_05955 [Bacteroides heparinolyticus]
MEKKEIALKIGKGALELFNKPENRELLIEIWNKNNEIKKLKIQSHTEIERIVKRYELCRNVLTLIFAERTKGLAAHYEALDKALASNDRELIINSLRGISTIIAQNPLESFSTLTAILNNEDETLKLDF